MARISSRDVYWLCLYYARCSVSENNTPSEIRNDWISLWFCTNHCSEIAHSFILGDWNIFALHFFYLTIYSVPGIFHFSLRSRHLCTPQAVKREERKKNERKVASMSAMFLPFSFLSFTGSESIPLLSSGVFWTGQLFVDGDTNLPRGYFCCSPLPRSGLYVLYFEQN